MRVVPDISGIEGEFDYIVPPRFDAQVRIGTIVRVVFHGRRVRAWVIADNVTPPAGKRLLEVTKVTGWGPPQELIDIAGWAAHRWIGKRAFHLQTASPLKVIAQLPPPFVRKLPAINTEKPEFLASPYVLLRLPPAESPLQTVLACDAYGPILLIAPTQRSAEGWLRRLRAEGRSVALYPQDWARAAAGGMTVVGTRAAAWAPMPELSAVVVLDAHDHALQSESSPTWNAIDVVRERARRRDVPVLCISATPRATQIEGATVQTVSRENERRGWAPLHIVDMRHADPRSGLYPPVLVNALRSEQRVLCVINRKGRAQLLVCTHCDEIARCEKCHSAQELTDETLRCRQCKIEQPIICRHCGGARFKQLRIGVSKVREELQTLAQREVGEVTGDSSEFPNSSVIVGTEALLHRATQADVVAFLDFDQELLSPRINAAEDAFVLLGRASRLVGGHKRDGIVIVQTRQPEHDAIEAALHGDPERFLTAEMSRRQIMDWPPFVAHAAVSGVAAEGFIERLPHSVDILGPLHDRWLIQAPNHEALSAALWEAKPGKGVRIEVDPPRA